MKRSTHAPVLTAAAATLALVLTGCGDDGNANDSNDGAGAEEGGTRTVTDALGTEVEVPANPQQIVTLHYAATQPLYDLGLMPVGQGEFEDGIVPEEVVDELSQVPVVTNQGEPDLEEIALLDPDLILAPNTLSDDVLDNLNRAAPVYTFTLRGGDRANWQQRSVEVADAVNQAEALEELDAEFEARQEEIAQTYADQIAGTKVAVVGSFEENNLYVWGVDNMTGTILTPLGFSWSERANEIVASEDEAEATVSFEMVDTAIGDADLVLYDSNLRGEVSPFATALIESPLFQELPAVQEGHAYAAGKNTIAGYSDAHYLLDRVEEILAEQG